MYILLEGYKRKLKTAEIMLKNNLYFGDEQKARITIKASEYRAFIIDIERAIERTKNSIQ